MHSTCEKVTLEGNKKIPLNLNLGKQTPIPKSTIISIAEGKEGKSPFAKEIRYEDEVEDTLDNTKNNLEFIKDILGEIQGDIVSKTQEENNQVFENNFQCGECGKFFQTPENVENHMECEHKPDEGEELTKKLSEAEQNVKVLSEKVERLVAKNVRNDEED